VGETMVGRIDLRNDRWKNVELVSEKAEKFCGFSY
jgi:hypothetical protein